MCMELQKVTLEEAKAHVQSGGGAFHILDRTGDTKQIWDPARPEEVEAAQALFDRLVTNGRYSAFRVEEGGEKSERMSSFDPKAGKMILVPPMVGG